MNGLFWGWAHKIGRPAQMASYEHGLSKATGLGAKMQEGTRVVEKPKVQVRFQGSIIVPDTYTMNNNQPITWYWTLRWETPNNPPTTHVITYSSSRMCHRTLGRDPHNTKTEGLQNYMVLLLLENWAQCSRSILVTGDTSLRIAVWRRLCVQSASKSRGRR